MSALCAECREHSMGGEKSEAPDIHSRLSLRTEHRGLSEEPTDKAPREPSMKDSFLTFPGMVSSPEMF